MKHISVVLLGNPNTGKSSLFNALVGSHQAVGNYPGVTVEKKTGHFQCDQTRVSVTDLPGTYSLGPDSPDEEIAVSAIAGELAQNDLPEIIVCVVDASNLARNLMLVTQALELELPVVVALNMTDIASKQGLEIDVEALARSLAVPVVKVQANKQIGIEDLKQQLIKDYPPASPLVTFPEIVEEQLGRLAADENVTAALRTPFWLRRILLETTGRMDSLLPPGRDQSCLEAFESARQLIAQQHQLHGLEPICRYEWIGQLVETIVQAPSKKGPSRQGRVDGVLTHPISGSLIFIVVMTVMFQAVFRWALPLMDFIDAGFGWLSATVESWIPAGALRSLLADGLIAGIGSVVIFLPQIVILFFFIAWLEGCGYMARAAWLMDRLMASVGLSGRSFVPLLSSFACAIPGIMATRSIKNPRDRLTTMLVAPLMSCSARLPVYVLLIAACIPDQAILGGWLGLQGLVMLSMYMIGVVVAVMIAFLLKKTILKGPTPPFVMELPGFKWPNLAVVGRRMTSQGWGFIKGAGTLIMAVTVLVWAAGYFPRNAEIETTVRDRHTAELQELKANPAAGSELAELEERIAAEIQGESLRSSYLGKAGAVIEPLVRPLGWDWRVGVAVIASFPAREVVIGTMGVIYNLGDETEEESDRRRDKIKLATWDDQPERRVCTVPVALSMMVFFALCAQCGATLVVLKKETRSWRWPIFTFCYMTSLAYVAALVTYHTASLWI